MMNKSSAFRRFAIVLCTFYGALALLLIIGAQVSRHGFSTYLKWRLDDFAEIADVGIMVSKKPYFALYADELSLLPVGYAHVDGRFIGWGGGQVGMAAHAVHLWGLLVHGREELGWRRTYKGEGAKEAEAIKAWRNREGFIEQGAGASMVIDDAARLITGKCSRARTSLTTHCRACTMHTLAGLEL